MKKLSFLFCSLLSSLLMSTAFSQTDADLKLKTGDTVVQERATFDTRGREIYVANKVSNTAVVDLTESGKTFSYQNGIVVKYDKDYAMTYMKALNGQENSFAGKYLATWKPKDLTVGKKEPMTVYRMTTGCGEMKNVYDDIRVSEGTRTLKIGTEEKTIPVTIVDMTGTWSGGTCGTGKVAQKVAYSVPLDLLLGVRVESFDSRGFLNSIGSFETLITAFIPKK